MANKKSTYQRQKDKIAALEEKNRQLLTDLYKISGLMECDWVEKQRLLLMYRHRKDIFDMWAKPTDPNRYSGGIFSMMQRQPFVPGEPKLKMAELKDSLPEASFIRPILSHFIIDQEKIGKQIEEKWANCSHNYIAFHKQTARVL